MIKAIVGSGGKTTFIKQQAKDYYNQGLKVFVTTSTHMMIEKETLLCDDAKTIIHELDSHHYVMAGIQDGYKIKALSYETYKEVCQHADVVFIEADGSKHMPLKFPNENEPVIYDNVDEIIVVSSLFALDQKASECVHRLDNVSFIQEDDIITATHIQKLLREGYLKPLHLQYPNKKITIHINHDDSLYQRAIAKLIEEDIDVSIVKKEWFTSQKELMICGGGHVSYELAKIASHLDFYIKVMDDRQEFANKERFDCVDEVICDCFENLDQYLCHNGYYVVVSRGHKDDYICVKTILANDYEYLGMIGSKLKVKKTFEKLSYDGFSDQQIHSIHAPIGLDIHAQTPSEIAISILAQIIQEKNKNYSSYISQELFHYKGKGTLCIIVDKKGSSPRGVGSMMFVSENGIIDSIGGGAIENAVIQEAHHVQHVLLKEYHLNNKDSEKLGMICGGSNHILFIPLS